DSKFVSATYRLFKTSKKPDEKCCCSVKYKGSMIEIPETFKFDDQHTFDSNFQTVSCDIVNVLKNSRYSQHLEFKDAESTCTAPCASTNSADPFELANAGTEKPPCCKKAKACC
ncbi:Arsenite methyltransferase, partial [Paramuricea clavata]